MTDPNRPVHKHVATAREHLAGVKGAQVWIQALMDRHLLDSQQPIKHLPIDDQQTGVTDGNPKVQ